MALGLCAGRQTPGESVEGDYALVRALIKQFKEQFGSTNCQALLGCDLDTREGQQTFQANHLIERCYDYAEGATNIATSLLDEQPPNGVS